MRRRSASAEAAPPAGETINRDTIRSIVYQLVLVGAIAWVCYQFALNAEANLAAHSIASGFAFLGHTAGFGVSFSLIDYRESDTYGRVFLVGLLNTLLVAVLGIVLATLIGFVVGIGRLSSNWLIARLSGGYVEGIRNLPLLFQILFWYLAVLGTLPGPRQSISLFGAVFLSNRGVKLPALRLQAGAIDVAMAFAVGVLASILLSMWAKRRRARTGRQVSLAWPVAALLLGLPAAAFVAAGFPIELDMPRIEGFNFAGGMRTIPVEFFALLIALSTYTAAFIAEIVRAGILAVPRGQTEAAQALGLRRGQALRLVLIPQALRTIIPPLTNQYLNLTKNSSLAVAIGFPDLFAIFAGTTLNQTGQAIEIIAITMAVYLALSLATSALMNWYNARVRLVER